MINLKLIRRSGFSKEKVAKLLDKNSKCEDTIFLFPEYAFERKFGNQEITDFLQGIHLNNGGHVFCSVYILETKEEVEGRIEEYVKVCGGDRSWLDNPLMRHFFTPRYSNFGYLVSRDGRGNIVSPYKKHISTTFDSFNIPSRSSLVKIRTKGSDERIGIEYDENTDHSKELVSFPNVLIDGKTLLEFRVCADIECSSENNPDVVLVSAHNLFNVKERTNKSLKNKPLIVNDSGGFFPPLAYVNDDDYRTRWGASKIFYENGIDVKLLR